MSKEQRMNSRHAVLVEQRLKSEVVRNAFVKVLRRQLCSNIRQFVKLWEVNKIWKLRLGIMETSCRLIVLCENTNTCVSVVRGIIDQIDAQVALYRNVDYTIIQQLMEAWPSNFDRRLGREVVRLYVQYLRLHSVLVVREKKMIAKLPKRRNLTDAEQYRVKLAEANLQYSKEPTDANKAHMHYRKMKYLCYLNYRRELLGSKRITDDLAVAQERYAINKNSQNKIVLAELTAKVAAANYEKTLKLTTDPLVKIYDINTSGLPAYGFCHFCSLPLTRTSLKGSCGHTYHHDCVKKSLGLGHTRCDCGETLLGLSTGEYGMWDTPYHNYARCKYIDDNDVSLMKTMTMNQLVASAASTLDVSLIGMERSAITVEPRFEDVIMVPFPVLSERTLSYFVVSNYRPTGFRFVARTRSPDGFWMYGYDGQIDYNLGQDWYVYQLKALPKINRQGTHVLLRNSMMSLVRGHSCHMAMQIAVAMKAEGMSGITDEVITGDYRDGVYDPLDQFEEKRSKMAEPQRLAVFPNDVTIDDVVRHTTCWVIDTITFGGRESFAHGAFCAWAADAVPKTKGKEKDVVGKSGSSNGGYWSAEQRNQRKQRAQQSRKEFVAAAKFPPAMKDTDQVKLLKKKLLDAQAKTNQLRRDMSDMALSLACDDEFTVTGKSNYTRSLLLPDTGAVTAPDGIMRRHALHSETITYNFTVANSDGLFILFPNNPRNLIGYHYVKNGAGHYTYDRSIYTAQDLKLSYDYSKRISQVLHIYSSTVPSGVYALNGTFNAVTIEGTLSEIPGLNGPDLYNTILASNVDPLDKIGNVLAGDGVTVLSLIDGFNQPYTRLGDNSPSVGSVGTVINANIEDGSSDLIYNVELEQAGVNVPANTNTFLIDSTFNFDSTVGAIVSVSYSSSSFAAGTQYRCTLDCIALGPFGDELVVKTLGQELTVAPGGFTSMDTTFKIDPSDTGTFQDEPVAALRVRVVVFVPAPAAAVVALCQVVARAPLAARSGVVNPINLVAYSGVAPGSVITISGWSNYQLIPGPTLRQNQNVKYHYKSSIEEQFAKALFGRRTNFGIRSVWNRLNYNQERSRLEALCSVGMGGDIVADASVGKVLSGIKGFFGNALGNLAKKGITSLIGGGASGAPIGRSSMQLTGYPMAYHPTPPSYYQGPYAFAATGDPVRDRLLASAATGEVVTARAADHLFDDYVADSAESVVTTYRSATVAFPTILTSTVNRNPISFMLYVATTDIDRSQNVFTRTVDGKRIYGLKWDGVFHIPTGVDIALRRVNPISFLVYGATPKVNTLQFLEGPLVVGHSCEAAIYLLTHSSFKGVAKVPLTGACDADGNVATNGVFDYKLQKLHEYAIPLAGNDINADVVIESLADQRVVDLLLNFSLVTH